MKKLTFIKSLFFVCALTTSQFSHAHAGHDAFPGTGFGPGGDPDHQPKPPVYSAPLEVPRCNVDSNTSLNQRDVTLEDILAFLERFQESAPKIKAFREMQARGEIAVEQLTDYIRRQTGSPSTVVATFQYQPREKLQHIYVNFDGDLGVVAIHFYHELIHALDPQLRSFYQEFDQRYDQIQAGIRAVYQKVADRLKKPIQEVSYMDFIDQDWKNLKDAKRFQNDGVWRIEFHAFSSQMVLIKEMTSKVSCYNSYIRDQDRINGLHLVYDDIKQHLEFAYGLYEPGSYMTASLKTKFDLKSKVAFK